jgi:tripeptide aminopeptidase
MVDGKRVIDEFMELVQIDSFSKNERLMVDALKKKLDEMNAEYYEDDAGSKYGGNAGNLVCCIKGNKKAPVLLFSAHTDTVTPGIGKKPVLENGVIKSNGNTILGADDVSGIVCMLEAIRTLKDEEESHGDVWFAFTMGEEEGLYGSKALDLSKINADYGIVLDSGIDIGTFIISAPSHYHIEIIIKGKAAHAGIEPEKGINAIFVASKAIADMELGRIDSETTANVGIIHGGSATNIICDEVKIEAEIRSRNQEKMDKCLAQIKKCVEDAANAAGAEFQYNYEMEYKTFDIDKNCDIIYMLDKATTALGLKFELKTSGGGSDTNIFNEKGLVSVNMNVGMNKPHTLYENILADDLVKAAELVVSIIKTV